jgi:CRP/FNR family transcriptional regulator, anaerobic regulatory protein
MTAYIPPNEPPARGPIFWSPRHDEQPCPSDTLLQQDHGLGPGRYSRHGVGEIIYRQGQPSSTIHTVCSGLVKLTCELPDGSHRVVRLLHPDCAFGLEALLGQGYMHQATSVGRTEICQVSAQAIRTMAIEHAERQQALMEQWRQALIEADFVIARLSTGPARERVARLILHLCRASHGNACQAPSREDMASLMGLTPETVSRTTATLKRDHVIAECRGVFTCDMPRLSLACGGAGG